MQFNVELSALRKRGALIFCWFMQQTPYIQLA